MMKHQLIIRGLICIAAGTLTAGLALAAEVFPGTSGDIADPIAWGGTYAETMTLPTSFRVNSGTYYFSSNVTFSAGYGLSGGTNPLFDQTDHPGVIVKLGGGIFTDARYQGQSARFKGGFYDLNFRSLNTYTGGDEEGVRGGTFTMMNGVVMTNVQNVGMTQTANWKMVAKQSDSPTTMNLETGARLFTKDFTMGVGDGFYCRLFITGGSEVHTTDFFKMSNNENVDGNRDYAGWPRETLAREGRHQITVDGANSLLDVGGDFWCGTRYFNNTLTVTNGGLVKVGGVFYSGYGGASNVTMTVTGAGSALEVDGYCYVAHGAQAASNQVLVANGGTLKVMKKASDYVGNLVVGESSTSHDNRLIVEGEGTVVTGLVQVGCKGRNNTMILRDGAKLVTASGMFPTRFSIVGGYHKDQGDNAMSNTLIVAGAQTTIDWAAGKSFSPFGGGDYGRVVFTDGFKWPNAPDIGMNGAIDETGSGCCLEISDGAIVGTPGGSGTVWSLCNTASLNRSNNWVYIARGGVMNGRYLYMNGKNNCVVISNGTFSCNGGWTEIGYNNNTSVGFVLQGTTPKITTSLKIGNGQAGVTNDFMRFEVPAEGYAAAALPLATGTVHFYATGTIQADVSAWVNNKANETPVEYRLMSNVGTLADEKIAAANAKLPQGCRFRKDGTNLYLRCARPKGFIYVVR